MKARIRVMLKPGILDPQGAAIAHALKALGFNNVAEVRVGKLIELELTDRSPAAVEQELRAMCEKLLANPVIEEYRIEKVDDRRVEGEHYP